MTDLRRHAPEPPYQPGEAERNAFGQMQARLIALLLRHREGAFRRLFALREHTTPAQDLLGYYRDLGVLFHLADTLFDDILPRITRRLSFETPHERALEEPPTRGRVDWERTLAAVLDDRPGEPPLLFRTRLRRRDFATPPNLLTVATLIEYRRTIEHLLWAERNAIGATALRHPLNAIAERCRRELAFPQFAGLCARAEAILAGADGGVEALESRVRERLAPGSNAAYQDLLAWREQLRALRLLQHATAPADTTTLGADPRRDNYLYQLWIFFELADLLIQRGCLEELAIHHGRMRLVFHWGTGPERCRYDLLHDQAVPEPAARWSADRSGLPVPGIRPDYYLRRSDPPPQRIEHAGTIYWHEPGVIWDAKYYREREQPGAPAAPIKRMLADLALLGLSYGVLLFAFLRDPATTTDTWPNADAAPDALTGDLASEPPPAQPYRIAPLAGHDQPLVPDQQLVIERLLPGSDATVPALHRRLAALLDEAHARLRQPRVPRCHGIFLDTLSAAEATWLRERYGAALDDDPADLLVCPKPHIGAWRVDLVSRARHCCQDPRVCQIIGDPDRRKPVRPPRSAEELLRELQELLRARSALDDAEVSALAQQIEHLTRRFAELSGAYRRINLYYNRLRDLGMHRTLELLAPPERESLALALFLVEQLDSVGAADYSAPAIHLSSVLELEVKRRIYACPGLVSEIAHVRNQTLGRLAFLRLKPWLFDGDWERILAHVARSWDGHVDADDPDFVADFDQFVNVLNTIARMRNRAAHTDTVARHDYGELQRLMLQSSPLRIGVLNVLLLAWRAH